MNIIVKIAKKVIIKLIRNKRGPVIEAINEKIDIPKMTESQERKLIESIFDSLFVIINRI